jgi:hypothetical protein
LRCLSPPPQFRLRITCGALPRDIDGADGDIAALQARAALTLRQAANLSFGSIMVAAPLACSFALVQLT